jgi:hypothetical protein
MMPLEECIRQQAGSYGFSCPSRLHAHASFCRSALARDAMCHETMMPLEECIRQQAGSYGRHSPTDTSFAADPRMRTTTDMSFAADPAYARVPPPIRHPRRIRCRSALARDGGLSGDEDAAA